MDSCVAGSLGRPDMYADSLSQKDRSVMALNLQAQTLADAAKVTPHPALSPHLPCPMPTLAMPWLSLGSHSLTAGLNAVCLIPEYVFQWILLSFKLILPCIDAPLFVSAG